MHKTADLSWTGAATPGSRDRIGPAPLDLLAQRNEMADSFFYDVSCISDAEAAKLRAALAHEGSILVVPPSGQGTVAVHRDPEAFYAGGGAAVRALTVAGVGSSALGAAAFARNVVDATGGPVAAVVSGYGMTDIMTEALGGYFLFGAANAARHLYEKFATAARGSGTPIRAPDLGLRGSDVLTVRSLLMDKRAGFRLVTGHSKGNLVISEALFGLRDQDPTRIAKLSESLRVVTVSAIITMPQEFAETVDIIGALDAFGRFNSRPDIRPERVVPWAWHHTDTRRPFHLDVTAEFRRLAPI